ncbi:hypothetical protein HPB51_005800 [Rhipicephalus microplus]|uniref:Uncharacterized protein n=1 Tax=Rhipicephalus microplus TaxID=6941 RepID=A0A9J6EQJ6_RHIMP|nr:hypothetical protein HPB51_005800 [Rhipicephalus microplus]
MRKSSPSPRYKRGCLARSSVHVPGRSRWPAAKYGAPTSVEQRRSTYCTSREGDAVMQYNVMESSMMFRTKKTTGSITREQLESGDKKFLEEVLDRDVAFMRSVSNTVQY